jgi:transposase
MSIDLLTELLALPQVVVTGYELPDAERLLVRIVVETPAALCPTCAHLSTVVHSYGSPRTIRDLDVWGRRCYLRWTPRQFVCSTCQDTFVERLSWLAPRQHHTRRFAQQVYSLACRTNIVEAATQYGVSDESAEGIFQQRATQQVLQRGYPTVRVLHVDEIASQKGHGHYRLILSSPEVGVLDVLEDRQQATLEAWFAARGPEWCATVQEFHADMWRPYHTAARAYLPNVVMTTADHFHVIENLQKALNEVRKTVQRHADEATRKQLKGSRWLLLKNPQKLTEDEQIRLTAILAVAPELQQAYDLKEGFRAIYTLRTPQAAAQRLTEWLDQAQKHSHTAWQTFVTTVQNWRAEILRFFVERGSNGFAEGINNKIKLILRRAFGCANFAHLRLRIIVAFGL